MKNNKGFTLIELLAVIMLLALVMLIAVPSIMGVNNLIKDNMRNKKAEIIEEAAIMLGEDMKGSIINSQKKYKNFPCKSIIISYLVPNYLDKDNDNECLSESDEGSIGCIVDPADNEEYLDKKEVIIYFKNKRMFAIVDLKDELSCS